MEPTILRPAEAEPTDARRLAARIVDVPVLSDATCEAMFALYRRYYDATSQGRFFEDLAAKDEVLMLYDETDALRGFSTLKRIDSEWQGRRCRLIFSGDTIVHHRFWGEQSLAFTWIRRAGAIKAERPDDPLYWLLIVKGHRTFRYLQAFARHYYPHWQQETPAAMRDLMDRLGERLFGEDYRRDVGVVRFPESRGQLSADWAQPSDQAAQRPEVQFFLHKNPGYRQGDELLCLTELSPENLRPLARRLFEAGMAGAVSQGERTRRPIVPDSNGLRSAIGDAVSSRQAPRVGRRPYAGQSGPTKVAG